jgi:hypothetical protein
MALYQTEGGAGFDPNQVFYLDLVGSPEYPAPPFAPGTLGRGTDGTDWTYCNASIAISAGGVVLVSTGFSTANGIQATTEMSVALIGGATVANAPVGQLVGVIGGTTGSVSVTAPSGTQTGAYFWIQRAGNCPNVGMTGTGTTLTQLHSSATVAGVLNAATGGSGTTYQVAGIAFTNTTASATGPNQGVLNYPYVSITN